MSDALGRAHVEIEPDFSQFNREVDAGLRRATRQIESRIRGALANVEDRFGNFGSQITGIVGNAFGDMARDAERAAEEVGESISDGIGEGLDSGLTRDVNGRLRDQYGRFAADGSRGGRDTGGAFGKGFSDELSKTLSSLVGIRLPTPAFALLGGAMAAAAASAVQLAAALAPAVGIVAALPSGIGVLAAGLTTLNVATLGVADAFAVAASGSAEEFSEAMEGLAPPVQDAAQAIRDLMPELDELRNSVQAAFFQDFDDVLNSLADTLLGPVTSGMTSVASSINGIITGLTGVATSSEGVEFVNQSFAVMSEILGQLQEPLTLLFGSLLSVGTAINEAFGEGAGAGLADMITQFAAFLDQAAASGQATQWITDALAVFQQIGAILTPIVGIFQSIGAAASTTGGNILGAFGTAVQVFDDFLASAEGQAALVAIFEALNQVGESFGTVLAGIAPALPPIISGISGILSAVAPLLGPLSQLVGSVLTALAPILGIVAAAIQPLIAPLTTIVTILGEILVGALTAVMPLIEVLANALGSQLAVVLEVVGAVLQAVAPIFTVLFEALGPIIEALAPLYELLGVVADIVGAVLGPIIQVLGDILLWLVEQVIVPFVVPIIEFLAELLTGALGTAIEWIGQQFELFGAGLEIVWNFIRDTVVSKAEEMVAGFQALVALFKAGWAVLNSAVFTPIKNGINNVKTVVTTAIDLMTSGFQGFVSFVKGIPGKISGALSDMFAPLASGFRSAINSVISGWNNLSFTLPSVDIPGVGTVGGATLNTPNIPLLNTGGFITNEGLAMLHPNEMVLPLSNANGINALADALSAAGLGTGEGVGNVSVIVKIGERELTDIVDTQVTRNNKTLTRRARAGTGRN